MSAALKLNPETELLSQKPRLGKKIAKPRLVWENPKLSAGTHKEKSKARLRVVSGQTLYGYVLNDPINLVDPDGNNPLAVIGVGAIVGGAASFAGTLLGGGSIGDAFKSIPGGALQGAIITLGGIGGATTARLGIGFILGLGANLITVGDVIADDNLVRNSCR